jgi:molybdopterin converting factor subunit 1
MNQIKIFLFASLRDYVGAKTIELELAAGTTIADLKELLVRTYPKLSPARNSMLAAINREYAADEQLIPLHAEIAFFPPVSGG